MGCTSKWRGSEAARQVPRGEGRGPQKADHSEMGLGEKSMWCCGKGQGLGRKPSPISTRSPEPTLRTRSEATGYGEHPSCPAVSLA